MLGPPRASQPPPRPQAASAASDAPAEVADAMIKAKIDTRASRLLDSSVGNV